MSDYDCLGELTGWDLSRWLDYLQSIDPNRPLRTSRDRKEGGGPGHRDYWGSYALPSDALIRQSIQYRTVLSNEIVFDLDYRSWSNVERYGNLIIAVLEDLKIPYMLTDSGGKGIHIHVWFEAMGVEGLYGWRQLRHLLWEMICRRAGFESERGAWMGRIDPAMWQWGDTSQGRLVRLIGGQKGRYKAIMEEIPSRPFQHPVSFPESVQIWEVPDWIIDSLGLAPIVASCRQCPGPPREHRVAYDSPEWIGCMGCGYQKVIS